MLGDRLRGEEEEEEVDGGLRRSEDLEEEAAATLSEPVRANGEEALGGPAKEEVVVVVLGEDLWAESEPGVAVRTREALVRLKEEEAVLRAKPGSGDDGDVALCKGVVGALTLHPPPPPA